MLACTNLALRRIFAQYLASEGLVTLLTQVICGDGRMTARDAVVCGAANALRNTYDVLSISPEHLDQVRTCPDRGKPGRPLPCSRPGTLLTFHGISGPGLVPARAAGAAAVA